MIETGQQLDTYLSHFEWLEKQDGNPAWLHKLRRSAMERFLELGFPTTHNEDWKYTNVSRIAKTAFRPASTAPESVTREILARAPFADIGCRHRLVFVNGRFSRELSALAGLPAKLKIGSLGEALRKSEETVENHLALYARCEDQAFVSLNTAFLQDGALVVVPRGLILEDPIHLLFVATQDGEPAVSHPRSLILAGRESQATIIESYVSLEETVHCTNAVTEIVAAEGAVVDHYKLQFESEQAFHVATIQGFQERASTVNSHNISFGGALVRNDINSVLDAEGAECVLNGLFVATGRQHVDNHTALDHAKPHCGSRELYKGILDGQAVGVFNGKIIVRKDAQKTNAIQSNKNLLLSEDAVINTKPQLEIYADDVRCTHGATVGQLDQEALFYMQSRGIEREAARDLLTYAFAGDVFDRMKVEALRGRLEEALYRKLSRARHGKQI